LDAIIYGEGAEFVYPFRKRPDIADEFSDKRLPYGWLSLQQPPECRSRHRGDEAVGLRLNASTPGVAIDCGVLAEYGAGTQITKAHGLAGGNIS
jgi:hypothetical protein